MAVRNQRAVGATLVSAGLLLFCSTARAQPGVPESPPIEKRPEPPKDVLGRNTPRGTVLGFLIAAREGNYESAARYLNTHQLGTPAADLARQLFIVLDRRLPAGLAQLSDRPEGSSPLQIRSDRNVIGTISSEGETVDIVVERVDRGKDGLLWLFSGDTLKAVPGLYTESSGIPIEDVIPKFLVDTRIARTPLYQWLAIFVGMPLLYLFTALLNRLLGSLVGQARRRVSKREALPNPNVLPVPVRLLFMALIIRWVLSIVTFPLFAREFWTATAGVITIVACVWALILLTGVAAVLLRPHLERVPIAILRLGQRAIQAVFIIAGMLIAFRYFGVNLTAALAGLSVGGIAIALAAQKTMENVIGGISVVFDRVARVGELVKVGDDRGFVEHVGLRSTRIRTFDRTVVSIPNGQLANVSMENISIRDKFWFHHTLRLRHETSVSTMREILDRVKNLLAQCPRVERGSVRVRFLGFGTSSLDVEIFVYVFDSDWNSFLETQENLLLDIMEIVQAAGTGLAYPSQTLYVAGFNIPDRNAPQHATTDPSASLQSGRRREAASGREGK